MAVLASIDVPFIDHDTDSQTVDDTGDTLDQIFTNLTRSKQREIMLRNRGAVDINYGKTTATARWPIEPGDVLRIALKDLTKGAIKSASGTPTIDIFQVL